MKKILIASDLRPVMLAAMQFLKRSDVAVITASTNDEMLKRHAESPADLIVAKLDFPGLPAETLFNVIRRGEATRHVSAILICEDTPDQRARGSRCQVNTVLSLPLDLPRLAGKVRDFLGVAPRRAYRVVFSVAAEGKHDDKPFICSTENISTGGMLMRTAEILSPNDRIVCSFRLPDGTHISTRGVVVRAAGQTQASAMNRYGIHFLSLSPAAEASIGFFVERERQKSLQSPLPTTVFA